MTRNAIKNRESDLRPGMEAIGDGGGGGGDGVKYSYI